VSTDTRSDSRMAKGVWLTAISRADEEPVYGWFNNPAVIENLIERRPTFTRHDATQWVESAQRVDGPDRKWGIHLEGRTETIGFTGLYGIGRQTAPELAILIGEPTLWGQGIGPTAQRLTIDAAFSQFDAHRVTEMILARNDRARTLVEHLGFSFEGILHGHVRRDGAILDVAVYGLIRPDLEPGRP
jgi:RimJ/RimL family protein N-acetyltransferase